MELITPTNQTIQCHKRIKAKAHNNRVEPMLRLIHLPLERLTHQVKTLRSVNLQSIRSNYRSIKMVHPTLERKELQTITVQLRQPLQPIMQAAHLGSF